ncbi:nitrile-specifier protein 5 [Tanacetum coccineum]
MRDAACNFVAELGPGSGQLWENMVGVRVSSMEVDDVHFFDPDTQKWVQVETTGEKPTPRSVFSTVAVGKYIFVCGGEIDPSDLGHMGAGRFTHEFYVLDTETACVKLV